MEDDLLLHPSLYEGYQHYATLPSYHRISKWQDRLTRVVMILGGLVTLGLHYYLIVEEGWSWLYLISLLMGAGLSIGLPLFGVDGVANWLKRRVRDKQVPSMMTAIVTGITNRYSPGSAWRYLPLGVDGHYFYICNGVFGVIQVDDQWILYLTPDAVTDCQINTRRVNSVTTTSISVRTVGGGSNIFGAHTSGSAESVAEDQYVHVVDIYTTVEGYNHVSLWFGEREAWAKEAYGKIRALCSQVAPA